MSNTYTYIDISTDKAHQLSAEIVNKLNSLTAEQSNSVKLAASDMKGKDSRAVIIYASSGEAPVEDLSATWVCKTFQTSSSYKEMYAECVNFLNNNDELTPGQKYDARISMTNASSHDSYLMLYYRKV